MYNYLHGMITYHLKDSIVIECAGIGYDVLVADVNEFPIGESMFVFTSYIHNENEEYLVGFKTLKEKDLYLSLTSVKGIGPKTALSCMSKTSVERLEDAIQRADEAFLMRLPGIGKKNASLIILELKGKLELFDSTRNVSLNKNMDLAFEGLKNYGFKEKEIKDALLEINDMNLSPEEYLKEALKKLYKDD